MRTAVVVTLLVGAVLSAGCAMTSFKSDVAFMQKHTEVLVLSDAEGKAQVAVAPAYQGRVMTSSANGPEGMSFGWINREAIGGGEVKKHINVYGGEDRFWMGPEGGQYAIFFKKGDPFEFKYWQTPAVIDTEPYELKFRKVDTAAFSKRAHLVNYSDAKFDVQIDRTVRVLGKEAIAKALGTEVPAGVNVVAYETDNRIKNMGKAAWTRESGLLSIWILGMFNPSPETTIVIPFKQGPEEGLGPIVNDTYFGKVPADRLIVKRGVMYFSGDGKYRSKIGLSPKRATPVAGSYDAANKLLTIVQYNKPDGITDYVNSMWQLQKNPYGGDIVNSYNDGPTPSGKPLGPFYELETSSPAAALKPGESIQHVHRTIHMQGDEAALDSIAKRLLGVSIDTIKQALARK